MSPFTPRTTCRLCGGGLKLSYAFNPTPIANELLTEADRLGRTFVFPLDVMTCAECSHVQLSGVVDPERLFRWYPYRSSASATFKAYLESYADELDLEFKGKTAVEIGSNDGTFLKRLQERGWDVFGYEPARNIAEISTAPTSVEFFGSDSADRFLASNTGKVDLVVANHVFAHADDLLDILKGVKNVLMPDGVFVFEVGYLVDVLKQGTWDVVYHEHVSYHHVIPLQRALRSMGLRLFHVKRTPSQGGSIRCYAGLPIRRNRLKSVDDFVREEMVLGLDGASAPETVGLFLRDGVEKTKKFFAGVSGPLYGYGAPAKSTTLLYQIPELAKRVQFIVEDSPLKQDRYTPGFGIPIGPPSVLAELGRDAKVVIFGWNFAEEIMRRNPNFRGYWVVPFPGRVLHAQG